ncbi:MAG: PDZ domain-containing protein [Deltaproteobacteria bacterium]|nr:MAG: PDZ domain-containing protein [Deltaproteobacteria bacterium]
MPSIVLSLKSLGQAFATSAILGGAIALPLSMTLSMELPTPSVELPGERFAHIQIAATLEPSQPEAPSEPEQTLAPDTEPPDPTPPPETEPPEATLAIGTAPPPTAEPSAKDPAPATTSTAGPHDEASTPSEPEPIEIASPEPIEPTLEEPSSKRHVLARHRVRPDLTQRPHLLKAHLRRIDQETGMRTRTGTQPPTRRSRCLEDRPEITHLDGRHYAVERSLIDEYSSIKQAMTLARVDWHRNDRGKVDGFGVYGLRCGSPLSQVGLKSGDVIHRINGKRVRNILQALLVVNKVKRKDRIVVEASRRGEPMKIVADVR